MKKILIILWLSLGTALIGCATKHTSEVPLFPPDGEITDKLPSGWSPYFTGRGKPGFWEVRLDNEKRVFGQVSDHGFGLHFDVLVYEETLFRDLELQVNVKAISGEVDQGGGLVWRFQDRKNYYMTRINPLEGNYRLYKVVKGKRKILASADVRLAQNKRYSLTVKMKGNRIEGYLGDMKCFEVIDQTFLKPGRVGFWTKADAVTYFDDFTVISLDTEGAK